MDPIQGVDYAFPPRPRPSVLAARGVKFVVRYGGRNIDDSKMLTATELAGLRGAGIDIVANVEGSAGGFNSYSAGQSWAVKGRDWFGDLGMPSDRPIYFSVDVGSPNWSAVRAACQGAASVIGADRVGIYGGYDTIKFVHDNGLARWFWQTFAWSGGRWHPAAHIQQYRNGVTIDGADCDLDRAMTDDYGQWGYENMNWDDKLYNKGDNTTDNPDRTVRQALEDVEKTDGVLRGAFNLRTAGIPANSPLGQLIATPAAVNALGDRLTVIETALQAVTQPPVITQEQINAAVLAAFKQFITGAA